ncbi:zinc-binding dehydrogenase [Hirsutella rhossiliensis]|uniref:Zinc-binding dehydrogenase domain-containing protein n=1 Tax=Hirsutella rhossiliensis TaxID=111463 RepID=A0A9P8MR69_9HYPO|nr:zinc-binding dehydrogenase domain-containing protein [Hirsutella rhossiliensis]KAH0959927.1 zinc-binding dehydrogenase domain-containing protein [Hirsutella rhossiliensis]
MSTALPQTVRAVIQPDPETDALILTETALPRPKEGDSEEHLVQIKATSPCLGELTWERYFPDTFTAERERVPGTEGAGVVVTAPFGSPFKPGDEVYFRNEANRRGCLSDYTLVQKSALALKPSAQGWVEAAATPLSALTAYQGLFEHGLLDPRAMATQGGDARAREANGKIRLLITAASGNVGSWAVQLAAAAGAGAIVAVSGPSKADDVRKAGATDIIDYTKQSIASWAAAQDPSSTHCDMALDCAGGDSLAGCWAAIRDGGVLLSVCGSPESLRPASVAKSKKLAKATWFLVRPRGSDLAEITKLVDAGIGRPRVDSAVEFDDFQQAFDKTETRHANGKVVIKVMA